MLAELLTPVADAPTHTIIRGRVVRTENENDVLVASLTDDECLLRCALLTTSSSGPPVLNPDDEVLVWVPNDGGRYVILGSVRTGHARTDSHSLHPKAERNDSDMDVPNTVVLEAKDSITLRVGDGSITMRADGKIVIRGKDLVSHAQNTNRVKGGAVAIN